MLIDASANLPDGGLLADVVIVGSGPAGIALARELAARKITTILLESGGLKRERSVEDLNQGVSTDPNTHASPNLYRARTLGGASSIWGGRCVPLDPIDFEQRDWVPHSGWPISHQEIARWIPQAMSFLEAGSDQFDESALSNVEPWIEGLNTGSLPINLERFSPPTHAGRRYRQELVSSSLVTLVTHATCVSIMTSENGEIVDRLQCRRQDGSPFDVRGRLVVLAAGGMENARLLLASRDRSAAGLGNDRDQVGRYYMCHLEGTFGALKLSPAQRPIRFGFERTIDNIYARRRLALPADVQRRLHLRNSVARLHYPFAADPLHRDPVLSLMFMVKSFLIPEFSRKIAMIDRSRQSQITARRTLLAAHGRNIVMGSPKLIGFVTDWIRRRHLAYRRIPYVVLPSREGQYPLDFNAEQEPNPQSRLTLSDNRDRFDMPQLSVDWRLTEGDVQSVLATYRFWQETVAASGVGSVAYEPDELEALVRGSVPVGGHHIGTTRMSTSPMTGVVDPDCRLHGVQNLFVTGASVFPTCGHANPTLTIVALAMRLGSHLASRIETAPTLRIAS